MITSIAFDIPPDLWISSNRMPTQRHHLHAIAVGLHQLAALTARRHRITEIPTPVTATWTVHYAKGTGKADAANAQPTTKRLLDGLVKAGVLAEDDHKHVQAETFTRGPNLTTSHTARRPTRRITLTLTPRKEDT